MKDIFSRYYSESMKWSLAAILGSNTLLGNPTKLISTLGTGLKAVYQEPKDGFERGGIAAGGLGLVTGAGTLVKSTVVGTTSSIGIITNSLASGMLTVTGDNDFIRDRNKDMVRDMPVNIG